MSSKVQICNLAIARIGGSSINSLNEAQKESIECKRFYDVSRKAVLRTHKWGFSIKQITLALTTETYLDYTYAYAYPIDALLIHKIYNPTSKDKKLEYVIRASSSLSSKVILTDEEDAQILYTANVENTNSFDSLFLEALSWKLAADLAQPVRGDENLQNICLQNFLLTISQAQTNDSNEGYQPPNDNNSFIDARI